MAKLGDSVEVPDFGRDWDAGSKWLSNYTRDNLVIKFQIADGYAFYKVSEDFSTLRHIPFGDAWQIPFAHVRGLTKRDIKEHLERERRIRKLFNLS